VIDEADRFVAKWRLKTPHKGCSPFYVYGIGKKNGWVPKTNEREKTELIEELTLLMA
jgi:hypothetical protein